MSTRASRSRKAATKSKSTTQSQTDGSEVAPVPKLPPKDENPPHILVLPKDSSPAARVITIGGQSQNGHRYFVDPTRGVYEFTAISHPRHACRSWLLAPSYEDAPEAEAAQEDDEGYVISSSTMLVATPLDPLFILLNLPGVLHSSSDTAGRSEFETFENRMWSLKSAAPQLGSVLEANPDSRVEEVFKSRIKDVCDEQNLGGDLQYCLIVDKLARYLLRRAEKMASSGLPSSMEERFVRQPLEMPEMAVRREDSGVSMVLDGKMDKVEDDSKREDASGPVESDATRERATHLLRVRVSLDYMLANYIPKSLRNPVRENCKKQCDFSTLDEQLKEIARLKAEALALRSISDNISRKRGTLDDDEALERQEAKKRKKEEEEQKKKSMSQGVKKLMKANTSGMMKLSSFFTKPAAKK